MGFLVETLFVLKIVAVTKKMKIKNRKIAYRSIKNKKTKNIPAIIARSISKTTLMDFFLIGSMRGLYTGIRDKK
jgi:hypothetical protein